MTPRESETPVTDAGGNVPSDDELVAAFKSVAQVSALMDYARPRGFSLGEFREHLIAYGRYVRRLTLAALTPSGSAPPLTDAQIAEALRVELNVPGWSDADVLRTYPAFVRAMRRVAALASSPAPQTELSEEVIAREWDATKVPEASGELNVWWGDTRDDFKPLLRAFARRIFALGSSSLATEREAASRVLGTLQAMLYADGCQYAARAVGERVEGALNREYPLPSPPPAAPREVRLSDGSVVRYDRFPIAFSRTNPDGSVFRDGNWRVLLLRESDTGADFDAAKSLAASLGSTGERE